MTASSENARVSGKNFDGKLAACQADLRQMGRVVVAFSAGVDSTCLLALAAETLGAAQVLAGIGVSPSLPQRELAEARELAGQLGVELAEIPTGELENPQYAANPAERCYFCKHDLFSRLVNLAKQRGFHAVLSGANTDDVGDFRPGLKAGAELGVRNPLMDAGLSKADVREISRRMGLPTWDKPAMACLASRVPYGKTITAEKLSRIELAEQVLKDRGFRQVRVRDHDSVARVEVPQEDMARLLSQRQAVIEGLNACGYAYVAMDLAGFRSGSSNEVLAR
jgi:uncharacterized protein